MSQQPRPYPDHLVATLARYQKYLTPGAADRLAAQWATTMRHLPRLVVEREVIGRLRSPSYRQYVLIPIPDEPRRSA